MKAPSNYRRLLPYLWPQWPFFARGFICILGYVICTVTLPYVVGRVADFLGKGEVEGVARWLGLAALVFLIRSAFQYGESLWTLAGSLNAVLALRKSVYAHLQHLGLSYFERSKTGDLTYRLTEDIDRIGEVVNSLSQRFLSSALQLVAIPAYMFYLNWPLTLASFILAPLMAWLIGRFGQRMSILSRRSQDRVSDLSSLLTEVLGNIRIVQAFAAQAYEVARFGKEADRNRAAKFRTERLRAVQYPVVGFLEAVSIMLLFLLGGWQISRNQLTPQEFVSYITAVALLLHPIDLVTHQYNDFKQAEASVDRIFELMAIAPDLEELPDAKTLPPARGKVEYQQVSFAYERDRPVLQDLSLVAQPGEVIALVGPSGAGKTTLVNLLMRFYDPQAGNIFIDGINIRDVSLASLRRQIGIVPQETVLFSGTIAQNIAYGQTKLDMEAIAQAAQVANARGFIEQLPDGYQSRVGERGLNLSGGQRQRIAIARAILLDPRILILDEATSALDSESEALVQQALERATQNRTVFVIAHRLSTVRSANRILFLENGKIVESGNHVDLIANGGRYADYHSRQFSS
ncbi:MAG: ABC transporter ATP-binding protein [Cyanobacteria bacterium J06642_2]